MTEFEELFHIKELEEVFDKKWKIRVKYARTAYNDHRQSQDTL